MIDLELPRFSQKLFDPYRYKVLSGGRGSAKSETVARALLAIGQDRKIRVLCGREFQNSIKESVHYLLVTLIDKYKFDGHYTYTNTSVVGENGTEFIFAGVRQNIQSIKSMAAIDILWLEEADTISQFSWDILIPTIRAPNSEIWVTFNPNEDDDPTYTKFFDSKGMPRAIDDALIMIVNHDQNPFFPDVLRKEMEYLYKTNPDLADHVWGGNCRKNSNAQIFKGKCRVEAFEYEEGWYGPYFGADFGFSQDPSTLTKVYIDLKGRRIMVRKALVGYGIELDDMAEFYDGCEESREYTIRADNSRPETINHIAKFGFIIVPCEKWPGCVEDGIEWLRSCESIVIHPDCEHEIMRDGVMTKYGLITESKKYSFKVDRLTGEVLTVIVDDYNHVWDAIRYALEPLILAGALSTFDVPE